LQKKLNGPHPAGEPRYGDVARPGCALAAQRGEEKVNVPISGERFLFAAAFPRHPALDQPRVESASR